MPHAAPNLRGEMSCFPSKRIIKKRQVALDSPHPFQPLKVVNVYCKTSTLAGSLRNFRYASTMDLLGCPASHLSGLVAGCKGSLPEISSDKKISGALNILGICHHFAMLYLYSVFTVKNHFRNASTDHLNVPQSPVSLEEFAMDFFH